MSTNDKNRQSNGTKESKHEIDMKEFCKHADDNQISSHILAHIPLDVRKKKEKRPKPKGYSLKLC